MLFVQGKGGMVILRRGNGRVVSNYSVLKGLASHLFGGHGPCLGAFQGGDKA